MNLLPSLKYIWLTIRHKWFVLLAGFRTQAPLWRLIIHDWSKFTPSELPHYGRQFFGTKDDYYGFACAWVHHQNHNPHHWEYWIPRNCHDRSTPPYASPEPLEMPEWAVREMVADWIGASRAYEGQWPTLTNWKWFNKNFYKIHIHPQTRILCLKILADIHFLDPELNNFSEVNNPLIKI